MITNSSSLSPPATRRAAETPSTGPLALLQGWLLITWALCNQKEADRRLSLSILLHCPSALSAQVKPACKNTRLLSPDSTYTHPQPQHTTATMPIWEKRIWVCLLHACCAACPSHRQCWWQAAPGPQESPHFTWREWGGRNSVGCFCWTRPPLSMAFPWQHTAMLPLHYLSRDQYLPVPVWKQGMGKGTLPTAHKFLRAYEFCISGSQRHPLIPAAWFRHFHGWLPTSWRHFRRNVSHNYKWQEHLRVCVHPSVLF